MTIGRQTSSVVTALTTATRRFLGDPATDALSNSIPSALRRWTDTAIEAAIGDVFSKLGTKLAIQHEGDALLFSDTTYTEAADYSGMALPSGVSASGIYAVEDITSPTTPIRFGYLSPLEIGEYVDLTSNTSSTVGIHRFYSLISDNTATNTPPQRLVIRPTPSGRSIRIRYIGEPLIAGANTDASPLAARWNTLVAMHAAVDLMSIDDEVPEALAAVFAVTLNDFHAFASRQRGPEHLRSARIRSC